MSGVGYTPGSGTTVAAEVLPDGFLAQRVKMVIGSGTTDAGNVGATNPLPVIVSASAQVSGTITVANPDPIVTTQTNVSGIAVWLAPTQTLSISVGASTAVATTTQAAVTGAIVWLAPTQTVQATVNTAPTIAGASVTIQQGASVSAVVSGTITVSNLPGSTTGSSGMSGVLVWLGASQTVIVNTAPTVAGASVTIQQGASVSAVVSGTVSVSNLPGSTTGSSGMSGILVWFGANQTIATISTITTILGTQMVSIAQTSVSVAVVPTVSTIIAVSGITAMSNLSTVVTVLGTVLVSQAQLLFTTLQPSASMTGPGIWVINTASATVSVSVTVSGTISVLDAQKTSIVIIVTTTGPVAFATTVLMSVYQSMSQTIAGATSWVIPAGKTFRIAGINMQVQNSITTTPVQVKAYVLVSSATPTYTSTVPIVAGIYANAPNATAPAAVNLPEQADVSAGITLAVAVSANTSANVGEIMVFGYLYP